MFWSIRSVVFVFPFCCVSGFFTQTGRGGPVVVRGIPPGRRTRPAPERWPGGAVERGGLVPSLIAKVLFLL